MTMQTDEREKRKRNLVVIAVVLFLLVTATAVEVGIKGPELPIASNVVVIALFNLNLIVLIASNLINTSIEGWFKIQVERPLDESIRVAQTFYERMQDVALRHGHHVAAVVGRDRLLADERREKLIEFLQYQQEQYGLAGITVYSATGQEMVHVKDPVLAPAITSAVNMAQVRMALTGRELSTP